MRIVCAACATLTSTILLHAVSFCNVNSVRKIHAFSKEYIAFHTYFLIFFSPEVFFLLLFCFFSGFGILFYRCWSCRVKYISCIKQIKKTIFISAVCIAHDSLPHSRSVKISSCLSEIILVFSNLYPVCT